MEFEDVDSKIIGYGLCGFGKVEVRGYDFQGVCGVWFRKRGSRVGRLAVGHWYLTGLGFLRTELVTRRVWLPEQGRASEERVGIEAQRRSSCVGTSTWRCNGIVGKDQTWDV